MIDRQVRDQAAAHVRDFRDGRIESDQFEYEFPQKSEDRAIRAVRTMLWYTYDDVFPHKLEGKRALSPVQKALYDRCVAFLESDEEYVWPDDDFSDGPQKIFAGSVIFCFAAGLAGYCAWGLMKSPWRKVPEIGLICGAIAGLCIFVTWIRAKNPTTKAKAPPFPGDHDAWPFPSKESAG